MVMNGELSPDLVISVCSSLVVMGVCAVQGLLIQFNLQEVLEAAANEEAASQ